MILDRKIIKLSEIYFALVDFQFPNMYLLYLHIFLGGWWDWFTWVWHCDFYINSLGSCATLFLSLSNCNVYIVDEQLSDSFFWRTSANGCFWQNLIITSSSDFLIINYQLLKKLKIKLLLRWLAWFIWNLFLLISFSIIW